ncbi:hypothetical protein TrST_g5917 [Triparma strigata]|uniref:Methyltransferase domain-containing protein n=1 Tax=Triparma strigata TaxID=1606541 RepID=A0A9W7AP30_9STRA|nr:hypothetical protein TrST_g5917 [Triparma strigata]
MPAVLSLSFTSLHSSAPPPTATATTAATAKTPHPKTFDPSSTTFLSPLNSGALSRDRLHRYYDGTPPFPCQTLNPSSNPQHCSTESILRQIIVKFVQNSVPIDAKEVHESFEFYLRTRKRLLQSKHSSKNNSKNNSETLIKDYAAGHGLTGLLFLCCNPLLPLRLRSIDITVPSSYISIVNALEECCPWIKGKHSYVLEDINQAVGNSQEDGVGDVVTLAIHACGSLTDSVIRRAGEDNSSRIALMPCCPPPSKSLGIPLGIKRMYGNREATDIERCYVLKAKGYRVDFASIPVEITEMNRIIIAERIE